MAELRGPVRYRFRSDEHDVQVLLEGESQWVQQRVEELGLEGVGWTMPISTGVQASNDHGNCHSSERHELHFPGTSSARYTRRGRILSKRWYPTYGSSTTCETRLESNEACVNLITFCKMD